MTLTPAKVKSEILTLIDGLNNANLLLDHTYPDTYRDNRNIRITWPSQITLTNLVFSSLADYMELIKHRQYTLLLIDGSFIQISYDFYRGTIIGHRLCYHPAPFPLTEEIWNIAQSMGLGLLDLVEEEINSKNMQTELLLTSPLRFDYDLDEQKHNRSVSHLHIATQDCRLPVFSPLCLSRFIKFIFKNFYPDIWNNNEFIRTFPVTPLNRTIQDLHRTELYLDCFDQTI